ncbi:MAG: hypothetical protein ACKVW3_16235 [Phycisphaerales bacterium]
MMPVLSSACLRACTKLALLARLVVLLSASAASAQDCGDLTVAFGPAPNPTGAPVILQSQDITLPTAWRGVRLYFKSGEILPTGSYLRIISLDNPSHVQDMTSAELGEWRHVSAIFNVAVTHQLRLQLWGGPNTETNSIFLDKACLVPSRNLGPECEVCSPCACEPPTSSIKWQARIFADDLQCSAAMWSTRGCLISAGHCNRTGSPGGVAQFEVPESTVDGYYLHPHPSNQYPIVAVERDVATADWAVLKLGKSAGMTAFARQGELRRIGTSVMSLTVGDPVATPGYGAGTGPGNGAQKLSTGLVTQIFGLNSFLHTGYVQPGNSGGGVTVVVAPGNPEAVDVLLAVVSRICQPDPITLEPCLSQPWPVNWPAFLAAMTSVCNNCIRDCDGNGQVTNDDRNILLGWIATFNPMGDLTGDGFVNAADLTFFDMVDPECP